MRQLTLILLLIALPVFGSELIPHEAEYKVQISIAGGKLTTRLSEADGVYTANHVIKPTGIARIAGGGRIDETSTFRLMDDDIVPVGYRSVDELSSDKSHADVLFTETGRIQGTVNGAAVDWELPDDTFDRVAIQYKLMLALAQGDEATAYTMYDVDEFKDLDIRFLGEKTVKTRAGSFTATGVQHQRKGSSRVTTLWCVEELGYLPVLIEQHRKGKLRLKASLKSYKPLVSPARSQAAATGT
ncbi:MAG: DUF3108 domain-containing protein [Pseudomonadota bacterium]